LAKRAPSISHVAPAITDMTQRKREEMMRRRAEKLRPLPLVPRSCSRLPATSDRSNWDDCLNATYVSKMRSAD
jgi:hypothetical protein